MEIPDNDTLIVLEMARFCWERDTHDEEYNEAFERVVERYGLDTSNIVTFPNQYERPTSIDVQREIDQADTR